MKLFGPLPSFQSHLAELEDERRLMGYLTLQRDPLREIRYPYYDRGLLEFMYAIPREQIVRVGQRRSLMKRALVGIVPDELLNRRRKAFVPQEPKKDMLAEWPRFAETSKHMISSSIGIIDPNRFWDAIRKVRCNHDGVSLNCLMRTLTIEFWLRHLTIQGVLKSPMSTRSASYSSSLKAKETSDVRSEQEFS